MEVPNFKKSRLSQLVAHGLIISGRGGSKGGGSSRTPVEANDTVNSRAMASVLDLLGEGVIGGLIDGAKSIFLNDTPLQNSDNSYNFSGVTWWFRDGSQDQSVIDGFDFIETPKSVGRQLKQTSQVNVSLDSADSDRVRVVMKFPSLRSIDKKSGDTNGTTVQFKFQIDAGNGGGFVDVVAEGESNATISLTAKKTGVYYRSYVLDLPKPAKAYTLRAIRLTEDHTDNSYLYDDTYIDSIGEIVNTSLNYPNSALVGLKINSEQFGSSMPTRSYLIKGLKIRVPSNYNADTNSYDGNWDGTFKLASSSNPAWILFDLLTNTRYGLGQFVQESMINIGELYQIGRYCDAFVDDGFGGKEKRFAINTQITSRQDAYRVVQDIAGAFRGMVYWAGGMVHITQDSPADPVMLFSNSNVVNGSFAYKGSARKDRYSVALITYNNKEDGYKQSVEYVEDQEAIKRYGIRKTESVAFGCTSRGQAHRVGLWTLYTSRMESDVITFAVGMDSVFLMPGDIVLIADKFRAGRRNSGRIIGYTSNSIKLDAPVDLTSVGNHITFLSAEGKMVGRDILENGKNITTVTFKTALSSNETPVSDAVWVIAQPDLTPLQARVVSVAEGDDGTSFNITAIQNNPTKYEAIDSGAQLIPQNTTVLDPTFSKPSGLAITEGTYLSSPGNLSVSLTATWQGKSAQYYISWRRSDAGNVSNWKSERVTEEQFELRGVAENGQYDFQVYAVSVGGRKTDPISITYKVLGTMTAPDAPTGLTAVGDYRSIVLNWVNPASVDLDHIEVLASKTNDKSKAQLIAKVSGTTFSHNGLEDSVTWYYWVRAANKRGMLSALNSPLATTATTRDVLSFLKNKITESELGQDLIADIDSKAVATEVDAAIEEAKSETKAQVDDARTEAANAVKSAKEALSTAIDKETKDRAQAIANETTARNKAIADEASIRATAISNEVTARTNAIAAEVEARTKAVADEATARAKAVSDEAIARASAITDSVAVEASNRAKAVSDATAALDAKISKEARDRASAVSALDIKTANAINTETLNRISSIEDEARARADALLQEKNNRQSEIQNLSTQMQTANESLAQQISQIAAGTGEQFDSLNIWYFDTDNEGWTEDDGSAVPMNVTSDGWLKAANSTSTCRSPNNMAIDANAYRFIKLRIKKVGKPVWAGKLLWVGASEQGWSDARSITFDEPEYDANGIATLSIHDIDWRASTTIRRFRFDFLKGQDDKNYLLIDWIAVGRPTPGAGMAALQNEKAARVDADAAEAANRNALAVQMRGSYDGNDLSKVGSGLIFQEQQARVAADKAEATARQSLETKVNDSVSNINKSLDTLSTQDKAMASDITGLKSSLKDKADASALQTLKTSVDQQGSSISTQGQSITKLQNDLNTTNANVGKKADQTALTALQGTVTQQGKDISAANSSITNLKTSLDTTNNNVAKKADATAVNDLTSRVSATEDKASSQADSIVQLNNSLNNAIADTDASAAMPNNLIVNPSFERGLDGYIGQSAAASVVEISTPHGGTRALKVDVGYVSPGQYVSFVQGRTYEIGVWVKDLGATTDNGAGNNKLRIGNSAGQPVFERPYNSGTIGSDWTLISGRWKATETAKLPVTLSNYLTAGSRCFDDFYVIDVTDSVKIDANASALSSLQNTVTQQGKDIASQSTSITSLSNQMVNGRQNMWVRSVYSVQLANNTTEPTFSDINGKAPISIDEVPDAAKLDFASAGSYVIAHYKAFVKVNADTTITMAPGSRVFDDTGAVYVNGVRVAFGNAGWNTVSFDLKAGWSTVEFLVNQWTGQAYINLGFKLSEKVAQLNSALGMNALSNAISAVTSNVSTVGDRVTSTSQSVTDLRNSLEQTNANLANKADAQALSALQNTVTQQGKDIASASSSIASLQNNLSTTNANVAKKADATALNALQNTVTSQGDALTSQGNRVTSLENTLTVGDNIVPNSAMLNNAQGWGGHATTVDGYPAVINTAAWAPTSPKFSVTPGDILDFSLLCLAGAAINGLAWGIRFDGPSLTNNSVYVEALNYAAGEKKAVTGTITVPAGATTGYLQPYSRNAITLTIYNIKVTRRNAGTIANAKAITDLTNEVTQQGKDITSASSDISLLKNSLATTDANVAEKADSSALSSLQSTVTQQGKDLSSVGNRTTNLENNLKTTDANVSKKADASAVDTLQNTVTQQGKDITSASDAITSLNNSVGAMTNMGDNLIQDANLEGDGSAFRTQQNSGTTGSIVAFGAYGENSAGARMLKVNATSPGLFANGKKPTPVNGSRKFRYIVRAKGVSGSMNMLLRRWNFNGSAEGNYEDKNVTLTSDWQTITWDTSFSPRTGADGQAFGIYCHPSNAEIWIDSFQVFDITDAVNNDATASALSDLSTKVTKQGDTVSSQGTSITKLQNDLTSTKTDVSKKADASALQTLQNTVTDQGKTLISQGNAITTLTNTVDTVKGDVAKKADATALNNLSTRVSNAEDKISSSSDAITSLNSSLNQQSKRGANILPDGTFESYSSGYNITNGRVIVTTDDSHGGNKCIRVTRPNDYNANATDNSDNHIFSGFQVRDNAVFYVECWVKLDAKSTTMDGAVQIAIGMSLQYQDNSWQWPALIKSAKDLSADSWTKVSGYLKSSKSGIKQAMARISIPNVSSVKAGNSFLIDDLVITDVTDAYNAQQTADATASAVSTLQTTVSKQGDSITSQGDSITTLNNGLATANKAIGTKADASALQTLQNAVNQQGKDVASNTSNITALSNQIVNGKQGTWSRRIYKCQLSSAAAEPTFSDIQGLSPVFMDEVADAAKLDFSGAGSYVVAHYKAMVRVAADTTISVSPGSRVFDDSGAVYVNGVRQAVAISGTATLGFVLSSGWNTVEFLVNQWTGNAYINLGFKLGDKVAELYSGLGVSSLSTAINSINSNVNKVGDQTSSNSAAITSLKNSLSDTDSAVAKKADASALQTLQNTVTQQGKDIASQSDSVTNLSNALSNVSIGGVNLIKNSGDMAGWSGKTNEIFRGNAVISATTKAGSSYRDLKEITLDAPVDNAEYVYSFFAKGGENGQSMTAYFYNPNSTTSGVSSQGVSDGSVDGRMSFTLTTEWVRYWVKWKQKPGTGSKRIILARIQASSTKDQTVSITSPKLEVGNMPTEWSPAPSDMASSNDLSSLKTTVDANSSSIQSVTSRVQKTEDNISTQNTAITKLQGDLSTTNNLVSTKADSAALQTLQNSVTQQGKDISSQGTRVTSIENSLTSGANLIPNAKMLNGAQGWGGAATTVDGYAAVNSSAGWQPVSPLFEVTPGDTLDLSMMCLAGQAITVGWGLRFDGPSLSNATIYASNLSYQAGEKKAVSGTFVVPVGATTARLQPNTGATASLTVYNVVVTRRDAGTMANSSAIDSLTSTVQTQGDAISSVGGRTTSLENSLKTTNDNVSKKADSTTVQTLQNTVTQQGKDISAAGTNITSMQASLTRRTVFTVTAKGNGNSVTPGVFDESGKNLFTPGRSWALVTFAKQSDGSTVIATSKTYDVFGSANNGATMSADIEALASGTYVCVLTFDEPSGNRGKILSALESLGGTSEVVNSLPYRGAYILLGRKGMKPGDGLELRAPTGGDGTAHISTSVEFVNGVMMGLGAAGGVMMKADANASAITTLQNTVTQQGKDITSSSSAITSLQNGLVAANSNIDKKADATALQSLQNTVTQQGKDISTQSGNVTNLQNSLSATNTGLANLVADSDASKKIIGNLLTNSSFERGLEGFSGGASFIKVIDAQSPNSGSKILSCGAGTGTVSQSIAVTKDRTYKIGVFARCQSGTVVDNQSNNKLRIGNSSLLADFMFKPTDLPTGSTWKEISGTWKATVSGSVDVSINSSLKSGNQYFDDFYFIDITDIVNINATSNAVASLTSRVTSAEGTVSSHTGSITNLSNSLNSLNNTVSGKADASALQSLQNTVTQQGKDLSSASDSVTDLKSSLNTLKVQSNPWIDGTFETYDNNQQLGGSTAIVTTDFKSSGNKCLKVTRPANTSGNSDKTIGSYSAVRQSAKYRVEFWAMMPASEAPPSGWTVVVGLHSINKDGGNDWQGITFNEAGLGGRDQWVKFTGVVKVSPSVTRSHVWISTRGQSGSNTPGYAVYIDDFVITDITDAADAQATADANATAISSLQTKVSDIDGKVTAQTSQLSSMQSKVDASSSKVDQLSKTISDSQSTQASLNTSLQSQIDAQASANIKNQADLNSATTSIASIKSTQATQATQISAMAKTQTDMTASLNSQSASIQTLQEAVSNNDALNSTWMVKMQTNNNGQKYAAGIALGVDGKNMQSQFLVQADRFALINTSNGNTTTPFVIDNGVTYMNAAYIKDGSIGSAKVGDLMSSGFQENVRGWRISRDGTMNINGSGPGSSRTVITNGKIEVYDSNNRLRVRMGIF
ncbi:phage tail protein [Klebsiella pneumoniae]|uniref:phage tail tip fiber protein n=1 Tax=Klebsiella pneumoniae TaxID=573 RepID=UPI002DBA30B4|nr:phage tail protein [Klebsiella pneumoniae]MEB7492009.1 phage tail protein [Klebsiella pneumoniae]